MADTTPQHVSVITIGVPDVAGARAFYVEGLGWTPALDLPEILFLQVNHGLLLGLWGRADLAADLGLPVAPDAAPGVAPGMTLSSNVDSPAEVDAAVAAFESAGGTVVKAAQKAAFGGYHGCVADPDGLVWEIAFNPGLTVDDDGRVRIVEIT